MNDNTEIQPGTYFLTAGSSVLHYYNGRHVYIANQHGLFKWMKLIKEIPYSGERYPTKVHRSIRSLNIVVTFSDASVYRAQARAFQDVVYKYQNGEYVQ